MRARDDWPSCSSCPHLAGRDRCAARGETVVDVHRVVCRRHPAAREIEGPLVHVRLGHRRFWFFGLESPHDVDPEWPEWRRPPRYRVVRWTIEDVRGIPIVVTDGVLVSGQDRLELAFPGGLMLSSADVLGLAAETRAWRGYVARHGVGAVERHIDTTDAFTCWFVLIGVRP